MPNKKKGRPAEGAEGLWSVEALAAETGRSMQVLYKLIRKRKVGIKKGRRLYVRAVDINKVVPVEKVATTEGQAIKPDEVRQRREAMLMSQGNLAQRTHVKVVEIERFENGLPTANSLVERIATALRRAEVQHAEKLSTMPDEPASAPTPGEPTVVTGDLAVTGDPASAMRITAKKRHGHWMVEQVKRNRLHELSGDLDPMHTPTQELLSIANKLHAALERARGDINWMLNEEKFLVPDVFDYIDDALEQAEKGVDE